MAKEIITDEKILSVPSVDIEICSPLLPQIIDDLMDVAEEYRDSKMGCAGLAANQIGYLYRICLVKVGYWYEPIINPKVNKRGGRVITQKESCLSRPHSPPIHKRRFQRIIINYIDQNEQRQIKTFHNFQARVLQHEMDHFDGKLI